MPTLVNQTCVLCNELVFVVGPDPANEAKTIVLSDSRQGHYINWHILAADRALVRSLIELSAAQRRRILAHVTTITEA